MFSVTSARYFLYMEPTDVGKSFDGLGGLASSRLGMNPMSGDIFIFNNKLHNRVKMLRLEMKQYQRLYAIEELARKRELNDEQLQAFRQEKSIPVLIEMEQWLKEDIY